MARRWAQLDLSTRFVIAAAIVVCLSMAVLGSWINHQITRSVLATTGADSANFMRAFFEPAVQDIEDGGLLSPLSQQKLDDILVRTPIVRTLVSVKIWRLDGTIVYSSMSKGVIGEKFISSDLNFAASGQIVSEFKDMISQESAYEQSLGLDLIEVYAPLYALGTNRIIAVGEIYENGTALSNQLRLSSNRTWLTVGVTTVLMISVLYLIVRGGSNTIISQANQLEQRVIEAQTLAKANQNLRVISETASRRLAETNENYLRHLGAELHDGPAQLITLAALKVEHIRRAKTAQTRAAELESMDSVIASALRDIRSLSSGLILPEIEDLQLNELVARAVWVHEQRTQTSVCVQCDADRRMPAAFKVCIFRFIQEGLNNAFRHAKGEGQRVSCNANEDTLFVSVSDRGTGLPADVGTIGEGLGLKGLKLRVESLGGTFSINNESFGTTISMRLNISEIE